MERDTLIGIAIVAAIIGAAWYVMREPVARVVDAAAPVIVPPKALDRASLRSSLGVGVPRLTLALAPADGPRFTVDPSLFRF